MSELTPRNNPELFGHDAAWRQLMHDFANGRPANGLLVTGAKGIGKATLAYRLARQLLAGGEGAATDPEHPVFRRVAAGSHSDLLVIQQEYDPKKDEVAREIPVEQARQAAEFLSLTPGESRWRVVIIDSVDALNANGANAILKILEEPPPQAILILVSHNPGRLLPTIRSRCRTLKLSPLSGADFREIVRTHAPEVEYDEMGCLEILSGGAPGVALELKAKEAMEWYVQLLDLWPTPDPHRLHALADQVGSGTVHENWAVFMRLVLCLLERTAKTAAGLALTEAVKGEGAALAQAACVHAPGIWAMKWQQCADQFSLAQARHLDYKQVIISFMHSIASTEGFQIGNTAA